MLTFFFVYDDFLSHHKKLKILTRLPRLTADLLNEPKGVLHTIFFIYDILITINLKMIFLLSDQLHYRKSPSRKYKLFIKKANMSQYISLKNNSNIPCLA